MTEQSDGQLLFRLDRGDERAFQELFHRHQGAVYRCALMHVATTQDAEAIASETLFTLWKKRKQVRIVDDSVLPWLLVTAKNLARNENRSARRRARLVAKLPRIEAFPDHAEEVERMIAADTTLERIWLSYSALDDRYADVVLLCLIHEHSVSDAAAILKVPEGTVKSRLSRAKAKLRESLGGAEVVGMKGGHNE